MGRKARTLFGTVLGFAAAALTIGVGTGAVAAWVAGWTQVATVVYGSWAAKEARRKAENAAARDREGRKTTLKGGAIAKFYVYGRGWVPGVVAGHREPQSKADPYFWLVLALPTTHQIQAFEEIWFGDDAITPLTADGSARPGPFNKEFIKSDILRGTVPANRIVTVQGKEEDRMESIDITGPIHVAITRPTPTIVTGEDTYQDVIAPDATATKISATQIQLGGAEPGQQYTITYSYKFTRAYIKCWTYTGAPEQTANAELIAATAHLPEESIQKWRATDKLNGVPYVVFRFHVDKDVFPALLENIAFKVVGKPDVLDTRDGGQRWTDNPALCIRDYVVNECGVEPGDMLPNARATDQFNAQVNYCDIPVGIILPDGSPTAEYTYRTNIVLSTEAKPVDNLGLLLSTCDGSAVPAGSSFDIRVGCFEEPTLELDDSDFAGPPEVIKGLSRLELFNGVRSRISNQFKNFWPLEDAPPYLSEYYKALQGGREVVREIDLQGTTSPYMANRLCKQMLLRAMSGLRLKALLNTTVIGLTPEQTVRLNVRSLGMEDKVLRIKGIRPNGLHQFELDLQEDGPLLYEWDFDEAAGVDPTPNTNLPKLRSVPLAQNFGAEANESVAVTGPDGNVVACCRVFWDPVTDMYVLSGGHIELRYKRTQDRTWTVIPNLEPTATEYRFPIQRGDVLIIEIRLANALFKGQWLQLKRTTEDAPAPYIVSANELGNAQFFATRESEHVFTIPNWTQWLYNDTLGWNEVTDAGMGYTYDQFEQTGIITAQDVGGSPPELIRLLRSDRVTVIPGRRMVLFSQMYGAVGKAGLLRITWYTREGTNAGMETGTQVPFSFTFGGPEAWPTFIYFTRVPPTARSADVELIVRNISTPQSTESYWRRPFFGEAAEGQISLPPWRA